MPGRARACPGLDPGLRETGAAGAAEAPCGASARRRRGLQAAPWKGAQDGRLRAVQARVAPAIQSGFRRAHCKCLSKLGNERIRGRPREISGPGSAQDQGAAGAAGQTTHAVEASVVPIGPQTSPACGRGLARRRLARRRDTAPRRLCLSKGSADARSGQPVDSARRRRCPPAPQRSLSASGPRAVAARTRRNRRLRPAP